MVAKELLLNIEASIVEMLNSHLRKTIKEEASISSWDSLMKKEFVQPH